jgi:phospholipid/cholesterol/gamma-HCH transport system permease protein
MQAVADRAFLPVKNLLEQVGDMMVLTGKTVTSAVRPPYPYGTEFVQQFLFALRLCWFPLLISTVAINYGAPGTQAGNFLVIFGAFDRLGGFFVLASVREFAPNVTAIIIAGVAGTAITADLGARKIREELDALQVLGVDPVKNLAFGAIIAIVACYKGMTASGGAEGVGRAVNTGVVITFLGVFAFNYVFTQTLLATHPEMSVIK